MKMEELMNELNQFIGTEKYTKHFSGLLMTDGVVELRELAKCYWLVDAIASYQIKPAVKELAIQFWTLNVKDSKGVLTCVEDLGIKPVVRQEFITDFPEGEFRLYVQNNVILLPSEY